MEVVTMDETDSTAQKTSDREIVIYGCTECGYMSTSLGWLHAHVERHRGFFGLQLPWRYGDREELMKMTQVLRVEDVSEVDLEEIEVRS